MDKKVVTYQGRYGSVRAQSTLVYAFLIALTLGTLLYMQNYLKRSLQGQLQQASDRIGEQYAIGLTNGTDHAEHHTTFLQIRTAGWNDPTRITWSWGSTEGSMRRRLPPILERWPAN